MHIGRPHAYTVKKKRFLSPLSRFVLWLSVLIALLAGLLYVIFQASFWKVKAITFEHMSSGATELPDTVYREVAKLHPIRRLFGPDHILFYPDETILSSVQADDLLLKQVLVKRSLFSRKVSVVPTAYVPFAYFCGQASQCFFVSDSGVLFARADGVATTAFLRVVDENTRDLTVGSQAIFEEGFWQSLRDTILSLRNSGITLASVRVRDFMVREWSATTESGAVLLFSFDAPVADLAVVLSKIPASVLRETEYVDFRVPNKIYYQ